MCVWSGLIPLDHLEGYLADPASILNVLAAQFARGVSLSRVFNAIGRYDIALTLDNACLVPINASADLNTDALALLSVALSFRKEEVETFKRRVLDPKLQEYKLVRAQLDNIRDGIELMHELHIANFSISNADCANAFLIDIREHVDSRYLLDAVYRALESVFPQSFGRNGASPPQLPQVSLGVRAHSSPLPQPTNSVRAPPTPATATAPSPVAMAPAPAAYASRASTPNNAAAGHCLQPSHQVPLYNRNPLQTPDSTTLPQSSHMNTSMCSEPGDPPANSQQQPPQQQQQQQQSTTTSTPGSSYEYGYSTKTVVSMTAAAVDAIGDTGDAHSTPLSRDSLDSSAPKTNT